MSHFGTKDYALEVSRGNVSGVSAVNKFGRSVNVDDGIWTDIWDGAISQVLWVAPTVTRGHTISSDFAGDSAVAGTGARTIQIYGLTGWESVETTETISLAGTSAVNTVNDYVIIHRMKVLTKGTIAGGTSSNIGTITAMALTDQTVTATILPGEGQTQMAIYGIPSTHTAHFTSWYASLNRANLAAAKGADLKLCVNPEPDAELLHFIIKQTQSIISNGTSVLHYNWNPYFKVPGPAIIKVVAVGGAADQDVSAGFDIYLVEN